MKPWLCYLLTILMSYVIGCSSMALLLSKLKGVDLRKVGTGNLGASNTMITFGWASAVLVAVHDIGKAVLAVYLARRLFGPLPWIGTIAGVSCVLGHMYPFYLKFKGGKGFASYIGMTLAINWKFALIVMVVIALVTFISDYIVVGTMFTITAVPVYLGIAYHSFIPVLIALVATGAMVYKHRENLVRIANGTEIGLRRANKGTDRKA